MIRFCFLFIALWITKLSNAQIVIKSTIDTNIYVSSGISFIEDKNGTLTFDEVVNSANFQPVKKKFLISESAPQRIGFVFR